MGRDAPKNCRSVPVRADSLQFVSLTSFREVGAVHALDNSIDQLMILT